MGDFQEGHGTHLSCSQVSAMLIVPSNVILSLSDSTLELTLSFNFPWRFERAEQETLSTPDLLSANLEGSGWFGLFSSALYVEACMPEIAGQNDCFYCLCRLSLSY